MKTKQFVRGKALTSSGFTLIEVLVVMVVGALIAGIGIPSFVNTLHGMQLTAATNDLFNSVLLARSEAIKRNTRVALCKSSDGIACFGSGDWEQGWIVFQDTNDNGQREPNEAIVRRWEKMPSDVRVWGKSTVAKYVSYGPTGESKLITGGFQAGTITLCHAGLAGDARQLVLAKGGRPRVVRTTVASC